MPWKALLVGTMFGLGVLATATQSAKADILYFEDFTVGTSAVPGALTSLGLAASTTTATSAANFQTLLSSGTWDLVIFGEQGFSTFNDFPGDFATYLAGGGMILGTTWRTDGYDALMEADGFSTNGGSITTDGHPIFVGLGGTIDLTNPGWGIFSQGYSTIGGGVCIGTISSGGCAAVLGNSGDTLLLGPLFDTYTNLAEGELLVANSISFLLDSVPVPEPASIAIFGLGIVGLLVIRRRRPS